MIYDVSTVYGLVAHTQIFIILLGTLYIGFTNSLGALLKAKTQENTNYVYNYNANPNTSRFVGNHTSNYIDYDKICNH